MGRDAGSGLEKASAATAPPPSITVATPAAMPAGPDLKNSLNFIQPPITGER